MDERAPRKIYWRDFYHFFLVYALDTCFLSPIKKYFNISIKYKVIYYYLVPFMETLLLNSKTTKL